MAIDTTFGNGRYEFRLDDEEGDEGTYLEAVHAVHQKMLQETAAKYPTDDFCSLVRIREEQAGIQLRLKK